MVPIGIKFQLHDRIQGIQRIKYLQKLLILTFFCLYIVFGWFANTHLNQMEYLCLLYGIQCFDLFTMSQLKLSFRLVYVIIGSFLALITIRRIYGLDS